MALTLIALRGGINVVTVVLFSTHVKLFQYYCSHSAVKCLQHPGIICVQLLETEGYKSNKDTNRCVESRFHSPPFLLSFSFCNQRRISLDKIRVGKNNLQPPPEIFEKHIIRLPHSSDQRG